MPGKGENDFKTEAKYKQFSSAVEKALKSFEGLIEWHDLISSLARLNKVSSTSVVNITVCTAAYTAGSFGLLTVSCGPSSTHSLQAPDPMSSPKPSLRGPFQDPGCLHNHL